MTTHQMLARLVARAAFATAALLSVLAAMPAAAQDPNRPPVIIEYHHVDATGSVRVTTDMAGNVVMRGDPTPVPVQFDYDPWGTQSTGQCGDTTDSLLFAGKARDTETCLDDFGARYYRNDLGRFTAIDPALDVPAAIQDPQQWNRYAYARNSPLTVTDPDGEAGKLITAAVKLAVKGGDIYSTVSGSVEAAQTIFSMDARVGTGERLIAVGTLLADLSGASDVLGAAKGAGRLIRMVESPVLAEARAAKTLVIGRGKALDAAGAVGSGEYRLQWPSKWPDVQAEWKENAGRLRAAMRQGKPIRDISPGDSDGLFLNLERHLLTSRGWRYDGNTGYWMPPLF